ncbi:hypothetical protein E4U55_004787 [Claviceps digitariae]|nr:hypothetical protein E4U55_004787 [Claviceps digitariae]
MLATCSEELAPRASSPSLRPPVPILSLEESESGSAATVDSLNSIMTSFRQISEAIESTDGLVANLREWLNGIDIESYRPKHPWTPDMYAALHNYKALDVEHKDVMRIYFNTLNATMGAPIPQRHLDRIKRAINWADVSIKHWLLPSLCAVYFSNTTRSVAEARLNFIKYYPNALDSSLSIATHIGEAEGKMTSGTRAFRTAKGHYQR